jgi:hypothetical protein
MARWLVMWTRGVLAVQRYLVIMMFGDHDVRHVQAGKAQRGRTPGRSGPDDEHVGFRGLSGWDLGLGESVVEGRHVRDCRRLPQEWLLL